MQNKPIKKIFVCEFITGGGFNHHDIPPELAWQGQQMRDALLRDLLQLPYHIITTVDYRLPPPVNCENCQTVDADSDVWQVWKEACLAADAVWLIAPETEGYLARMTQLAVQHNKMLIGCGLSSIAICGSKLASYQLFKKFSLNTIETFLFPKWPKVNHMKWLAKPDDGAGCEQTVCFDAASDLEHWMVLNCKTETHIIQPYISGEAASISCVMHAGKAYVISCNKQLIYIEKNVISYKGCIVNGMCKYWKIFEVLANKIAQLLPDLEGYVGIDVIVSDTNAKQITIVEVNPRLTTSYIGLQEATGHNPAALIMNILTQENYAWPVMQKNKVTIEMSQHRA